MGERVRDRFCKLSCQIDLSESSLSSQRLQFSFTLVRNRQLLGANGRKRDKVDTEGER